MSDGVQASEGKWKSWTGGFRLVFIITFILMQFRTAEQVAPVGVGEVGQVVQVGGDRIEPVVEDDVKLRCNAPRGYVQARGNGK